MKSPIKLTALSMSFISVAAMPGPGSYQAAAQTLTDGPATVPGHTVAAAMTTVNLAPMNVISGLSPRVTVSLDPDTILLRDGRPADLPSDIFMMRKESPVGTGAKNSGTLDEAQAETSAEPVPARTQAALLESEEPAAPGLHSSMKTQKPWQARFASLRRKIGDINHRFATSSNNIFWSGNSRYLGIMDQTGTYLSVYDVTTGSLHGKTLVGDEGYNTADAFSRVQKITDEGQVVLKPGAQAANTGNDAAVLNLSAIAVPAAHGSRILSSFPRITGGRFVSIVRTADRKTSLVMTWWLDAYRLADVVYDETAGRLLTRIYFNPTTPLEKRPPAREMTREERVEFRADLERFIRENPSQPDLGLYENMLSKIAVD